MSIPESADPRSAWSEPGTEDLGGGVYRIPLPLPNDGLRAVNVYVLLGEAGLTLIDGGWALAESAAQLRTSLGEIGLGVSDIRQFLVTHIHRDHYTQAVALRREVGAKVALGSGEKPNLDAITDRLRGNNGDGISHLQRAGAAVLRAQAAKLQAEEGTAADWEAPDQWLDDRVEVIAGDRPLQVIATPGHTAGHVVFHDPRANLLFAGDHVLPQITPSIGLEPLRTALPLRDYLDSLRLMHTMPDARLLPAHGPVTASVHQRVTELLAHHAQRLDASEAVVARGAVTGYQAAQVLTWTRRERRFDEMDLFNQILATAETAAHLDVLVLQGRLSCVTDSDGVAHYQPS